MKIDFCPSCGFRLEVRSSEQNNEIPTEIWKPVFGWDLYEVSSLGRARSLPRYGTMGFVKNRLYKGRLLKPVLKKGLGYLYVTLHGPNKKPLQAGVHRLVLEAFCGPKEGMYACHNNGNPADNRLENLRWDTPSGNQADKVIHGTDSRGDKGSKKLTSDDVRAIRLSSEKQQVLADKYGVTQVMISRIKLRTVWRHLDN